MNGPERLRVAHVLHGCRTLGPGTRSVVWVAGCARGCPGCVAGPILGPDAGRWRGVDALAEELLAEGAAGVTFSGGEPFEQPRALAALCRLLRRGRDLSLLAYSGFTLAELRADPERAAVLAELDVLVDGPFEAAAGADLLWRGSANQRIHLLSPRHAGDAWLRAADQGGGVELRLSPEGRVFWAGVPPQGFQARLRAALLEQGVRLETSEEGWS